MSIPILRNNLSCVLAHYASPHRISWSLSPLLLFSTGESLTSTAVFDVLRHKHQFSPELASKVASVLNRDESPKTSDSILSFLKENGFSNSHLERLLRYRPHQFLSASVEDTLEPRIRVFQDFGFCLDDIAKIVSRSPMILHLNSNTRVIPSLSMLKNLLGTNDAVAKLLRKSGWFLLCDVEKTMVPNIEFLKSCGIPLEDILKLLYRHPRCLLLKPENIMKAVRKTEEMGVNPSSRMFINALKVVSSMPGKTWEVKWQAFRNCGFTESDIVTVFQKAPTAFAGSVDKIKRVKDILLATGKYDISSIVNNPTSLTCSIEQRFKPRLQILELLESKNLIKNWPTVGTLYQMPDVKFFQRFVGPYLSEVGEVYAAEWSARANRNRESKLKALA